MADVHSKETRSYNMSRIRNKNTKPEMLVRRFLFANGFRYRLHDKKLPGRPDIVLPKYRTVIFVNGCFWHGHEGCKYFVLPKTREEWWREKISNTKNRDARSHKILEADWNIIIIWECEIKKNWQEFLYKIIDQIKFFGYICPKNKFQMKLFGDYIRDLREQQNIPLRKVAAFLDIDTSILSKIERGEKEANKEIVSKLAEFFVLNPQDLLNEFLGESIAKLVYKEKDCDEILKAAEAKIEYLRISNQRQSKIDFNE